MVNKRPAARAARRRARTWGTSKQARDDNSPSRVPSARLGAIRMPTSTTLPYRCAQSRLERRDSCCRAAKAPRSLSFADGRTRESRVRNGLSAGGRWIRTIGTPPNFFGRPSIPAQFTFRNINRLPRDGDRWFESISLQRRVCCESDFRDQVMTEAPRRPHRGCRDHCFEPALVLNF